MIALTTLFFILGGIVLFVLHFLPAIIAFRRNHPNRIPILLLNIFLGWTVIAWIICLIWAFTSPAPQVVVIQPPSNYDGPTLPPGNNA